MVNEQTPPLTFNSLVLGFSSAALHYLGHDLAESGQDLRHNLSLAKQNIDILLLLKEKTKGNLLPDEEQLIEEIICDLQMKYVDFIKEN
jgi:hypothetical protein